MNIRSILRQPVLTLAIHDREARWTLGRRGLIARSGRVPVAPELVDEGVVREPVAAAAALLASTSFRGNARMQAVVALPAQRSVFRQLELPALRGAQFDELVEREIRREMPMLADNAYVSWKRTGAIAGRAQVFAAARAVGEADCIIAHTESNEIEIGIFRDGVPSIVRHVVMTSPVGDEAWGAQLSEELARTLKFYRDSHRDDEVVPRLPISFVGGVAQQAILAERLTASTGHEVALPPLLLDVSPEDQAVCFAANVGLAVKELAA